MNTNHPRYGKQRKTDDLTGDKIGKLTAIRRVENKRSPNGKTIVMWECQCDCGTITIVPSSGFKHGDYKSCGCSRIEHQKQNWKRESKNTYDLSGDYGIGYTPKGEKFYFDLEDYDKIKDHTWSLNSSGYLSTRTFKNRQNKTHLMHRVIMNAPKNMMVDHINGSSTKLDNRKSNLRLVTPAENAMNAIASKNNTSGIKGVSWSKSSNKWYATIGVNYKTINLGKFDLIEDAINARLEAEKKYFGEYSIYNRKLQPTNPLKKRNGG